jgi:hypothetical protein
VVDAASSFVVNSFSEGAWRICAERMPLSTQNWLSPPPAWVRDIAGLEEIRDLQTQAVAA